MEGNHGAWSCPESSFLGVVATVAVIAICVLLAWILLAWIWITPADIQGIDDQIRSDVWALL